MFTNSKKNIILCKVLLVLSVFSVESTHAAGTSTQVLQANELYASGDFIGSLEKYKQTLKKEPESGIINFNVGTAYYKEGDFENAVKHLQRSILTEDDQLRQRAYYNLGNALYKRGTDFVAEDKNQAIELMERALGEYGKAMEMVADDEDAKYNYEHVKKELDQLKFQQQNQKQDQKKDDSDQQNKDKNQKQNNSDQNQDQNQQQDKNDDSSDEKNDSQNNQNQENDSEQNKDDQNQDSSNSDQEQDQQDQSQDNESNQDQNEDQQQNQNESEQQDQQDQSSQGQDSDQDNQQDNEQQSPENENQSDQSNSEDQQSDDDPPESQNGSGQQSPQQVGDITDLTQQEAEMMLRNYQQSVEPTELLNFNPPGQSTPVLKDW